MGGKWVWIELVSDETLRCHTCYERIQKQRIHLYANVEHEVEEVMCEVCWKENEMEET